MAILKLAEVERDYILLILWKCGGNRTETARSLGIAVRTLRIKLRQYRDEGELVPPAPRDFNYWLNRKANGKLPE
jgi:two-component system response regulator FlrC